MSAEKNPEWLVDLLYAGEEEDEAGASPPELDLSDEERSTLARSRALLGDARAQLTQAAPREAVRASILEQARKAAAAEVAHVAAAGAATPARRANAAREPSKTIWSRSRTNSVAQIVAVALALVASAALLSRFQSNQRAEAPAAFDPVAEIAQKAPAAPAAEPAPADPMDSVALNTEAPAQPAAPAPDPSLIEEPKPSEPEAQEASEEARFGRGAALTERAERAPARDAELKAAEAPAPAKGSVKDSLDYDDQPQEDQNAARAERARTVIAKADSPVMAEEEEGAVVPMRELAPPSARSFNSPESKVPAPRVTDDALADAKPAPVAKPSAAGATPPPAEPMAPADAAKREAASAERSADKGAAESAQRPRATATIATVRSNFQRADYQRAVEAADQLLESGQGTPDQRAEIMDLKAQSLSELGQTAQADQLLRELERQYPDYYRKNNIAKRKTAPSKAKKRMYNFDEAAAEPSSASPAY